MLRSSDIRKELMTLKKSLLNYFDFRSPYSLFRNTLKLLQYETLKYVINIRSILNKGQNYSLEKICSTESNTQLHAIEDSCLAMPNVRRVNL